MAAVAPAGADRRMRHRIGVEACRRVGVAVAALDRTDRHMRRRRVSRRDGTVVAVRAIGIAGLVHVGRTRPRCVAVRGLGVTGNAILATGRHVTGIGRGSVGALGALARIRSIVTGIAARGRDRGVIHGVGDETRRRIAMAVAALNRRGRNVGRRRQAGRRRSIVARRAIGIAGLMEIDTACPAREARIGMTGHAVAPGGRHMVGER